MSQDLVIEGALLQWTLGVASMFDPSAAAPATDSGPAAIETLAEVQTSARLLCALQTVLVHDGGDDEAFEDVFSDQLASGRSAEQCAAMIVETLEAKYDRSFPALSGASDSDAAMEMRKVVELTLGWAMLFGQEAQKQRYIEHIFTLPADQQQALMLIIQEQQELAFSGNAGGGSDGDGDGADGANDCDSAASPAPRSGARAVGGLGASSPFGVAMGSPAPGLGSRRESASAFGQSDSPYKRLAACHSGGARGRKQSGRVARRSRSSGNTRSTADVTTTPTAGSGLGSSSAAADATNNGGLVESLRAQLRMVKDDNLRLHGEVADVQQRLAEREEERAQVTEGAEKRASELQKLMRAEMQAIERETELASQLEDMSQRNAQLRDQVKEVAPLREEVQRLRDDCAVLGTVRARLDKSEHMVAKLKERQMAHDDMAAELRRVQELNASQLAKIDRLTEENIRIPGLEAQVTSYQRKVTDTKVEMSLTAAKNREMQREIDALLASQSGLQSGLQAAIESNCSLYTQNTLTDEADAELGAGTTFAALGAAMSEVNPEIRERLVTLERENKVMREKLGKTDLDALDALEERLSDAEQLRDAFEGKYVAATKEIKGLQENVKDLTAELAKERRGRAEDLVSAESERKELCAQHESATSHAADRHARAVQALRDEQTAAEAAHAEAVQALEVAAEAAEERWAEQRAALTTEHDTQTQRAAADHEQAVEQMQAEAQALRDAGEQAAAKAAAAAEAAAVQHKEAVTAAAAKHDEEVAAVQEEMVALEGAHATRVRELEAAAAALQEEHAEKEAAFRAHLSEAQEQKTTVEAEYSEFRSTTEAADQRAKVEMLKMQSDTKKLYQSYTKVNDKSKQRAAQVEQLTDEVKGLRKKVQRLERERGVQESRLRMKQQSEELDELKAVVDDYKRTLKSAEAVRRSNNVGGSSGGGGDDEYLPPPQQDGGSASGASGGGGGSGSTESLEVARRKIEELSSKHRQLLFNNVELTMKKAEVARTLDAVMREKAAADEEITRLKVHVARVERAASKAGVEVHPLRNPDGAMAAAARGDLNSSFSSVRSTSSHRSSRSTRSHRTHHRSSSKKARGSFSTLTNSGRKLPPSGKDGGGGGAQRVARGKSSRHGSRTGAAGRDGNGVADDEFDTENFRSAADLFGDAPAPLAAQPSETLRRFTLSGADETAVRKARLLQMREKLQRERGGRARAASASGSASGAAAQGDGGVGCGSRLRRAARLAAHDENVEGN